MSRAPRAQLAIGGLPRIDVHKRRRLLVDGNRKFQREVTRLGHVGLPVFSVGQRPSVDAERLEPLHFFSLSREPSEGRPLDEVIEREQPAQQHVRGGFFAASVAYVGDAQRATNRFPREQHGARAARKDSPVVLDGELLVDERADKTERRDTRGLLKKKRQTATG